MLLPPGDQVNVYGPPLPPPAVTQMLPLGTAQPVGLVIAKVAVKAGFSVMVKNCTEVQLFASFTVSV